MTRPAKATIDLAAFRHNYRLAKQRHGGRALAVVKADAYGHGATACAQALRGEADGYAVAFLAEALALRADGITAPILLLEGVFSSQELVEASRHGFWLVVHHAEQIRMLESAAHADVRLQVWLKIDTGMHRAGFEAHEVAAIHQRLMQTGKVDKIVLMSHFARADEPDCAATSEQIAHFDQAIEGLEFTPGQQTEQSLCNSAGLLAWPGARRHWARPGIMLYGADPVPAGRSGHQSGLQAVMTLESAVMSVKTLHLGEALGYGARFTATRPTRVGLVALGYGDGYPRTVPNGTPVAVDGARTQIIGRVSMDMLTIDLTDLPNSGSGSRVELWGKQIEVNDVAASVGTLAYELLCNLKRVPKVYVPLD